MTGNLDDILQELKRGLEAIYGPRLKGVYLYGSRARGDAAEDSDIDVAMVLDDYNYWGDEIRRIGEVVSEVCLSHNCLVSVVPFTEQEWSSERSMFADSVRREGVLVP
jgi:uncharacterized protein